MDAARIIGVCRPRIMLAAFFGERHVNQRLRTGERRRAVFRREINLASNHYFHAVILSPASFETS